jgi:peptidoglycan/LPS O-acetylase OafA/YrhL
MVFAHHALPQTSEGWTPLAGWPELARWAAAAVRAGGLGVDLFFVLSSYLITELLAREHRLTGRIHVREFYVRRCLRIWPLYFVFLAAVAVMHVVLHQRDVLVAFRYFAVFLGNWECAFRGYPQSPIAPLWSVSIEEQFYIAWPLLLASITPRRMPAAAGAMLVTATLARAYIAARGLPHPAMWCNTFARLDPIALGILAVHAARRLTWSLPWRLVAALSGFALLVAVNRYSTFDGGWAGLLAYPAGAIGALLPVLAILPTVGTPSRRRSLLAWGPLVFLGRISYGLYVFHVLALGWAAWAVAGLWGHAVVRPVAGMAIDVALAVASYFVLEKPFLRLKTRFAFVQSRPGG